MRRFRNTSLTAWRLRMYSWLGAYGTYIIGMTVGMGLMILFVMQGRHSVGTAFVVFQYLGMLNEQIELVTQHMQELQKASAGLRSEERRVGKECRSRWPRGDDKQ